jgi:hypothetical protein
VFAAEHGIRGESGGAGIDGLLQRLPAADGAADEAEGALTRPGSLWKHALLLSASVMAQAAVLFFLTSGWWWR